MTNILGLDPGKTTGYALIETEGSGRNISLVNVGETKDMTLITIKDLFEKADVVVYESWRTRPGKAQSGAFNWGTMPAPEAIGAVKTLRQLFCPDATLVVQEPAIKPAGYGFANLKYVKGKDGMHVQDAVAHAVYYAVRKLRALPVSVSAT